MSVVRSLIVLSAVTVVLPVAAFSAQNQQANQPASSDTANLQVYSVGRGRVEVTIDAIGEIQADATAALSMTRGGRVIELFVQPGDTVFEGDPLLRLDDRNAQLAFQQSELALQNAHLQLIDLQQGPDEGDIRIAQANVNSAWSAYSAIGSAVSAEDISAAELSVRQAQEAFVAANQARRVAGGDSQESISLLDAQIGEASFNLGIAQQQLAQLRSANGPDLGAAAARAAQAQAELERVQAGPTETQLRNAQVNVDQAQINFDQAAEELALYTLAAPFDGVIGEVDIEQGALAAPGSPLLQLVDLEPMRLEVAVDEIDLRFIGEGMTARVRIDALADLALDAMLEHIALVGTSNSDGIISYPVEMTLTKADPRVRAGMTAEATVVTEARENVLVVPNIYIRLDRRTNEAFVNLLQLNGVLTEVPVELGLQGAEQSEIIAGLREGDTIAIDLSDQQFSFFGS